MSLRSKGQYCPHPASRMCNAIPSLAFCLMCFSNNLHSSAQPLSNLIFLISQLLRNLTDAWLSNNLLIFRNASSALETAAKTDTGSRLLAHYDLVRKCGVASPVECAKIEPACVPVRGLITVLATVSCGG